MHVDLKLQHIQNIGLLPILSQGYVLIAPNHHGLLLPLLGGYNREMSRCIISPPPKATTAAWLKVASICASISEPTNSPGAGVDPSNWANVHVHVGTARTSLMTVRTPWTRVLPYHRRPFFVPGKRFSYIPPTICPTYECHMYHVPRGKIHLQVLPALQCFLWKQCCVWERKHSLVTMPNRCEVQAGNLNLPYGTMHSSISPATAGHDAVIWWNPCNLQRCVVTRLM